MMARANSAKADYGAAYTLQCVLVAVLGGVDPNGGFGTIGGVTIAILILQMLSSGLNMFEKRVQLLPRRDLGRDPDPRAPPQLVRRSEDAEAGLTAQRESDKP